MNKINLSPKQKQTLCSLIIFALMQILIILVFSWLLYKSKPVDLENTKQITITVDNVRYQRGPTEYYFIIYSDSEKYLFSNYGRFGEYSNRELYESISIGDRLTLTYYNSSSLLHGNFNSVIEAQSNTEIYRSVEEYTKLTAGISTAVTIPFLIIELVFVGVLILYVLNSKNTLIKIGRKLKPIRGRFSD